MTQQLPRKELEKARETFEKWWIGRLKHGEDKEALNYLMDRDVEGRYKYISIAMDWEKWLSGYISGRDSIA